MEPWPLGVFWQDTISTFTVGASPPEPDASPSASVRFWPCAGHPPLGSGAAWPCAGLAALVSVAAWPCARHAGWASWALLGDELVFTQALTAACTALLMAGFFIVDCFAIVLQVLVSLEHQKLQEKPW